MIDFTAWTNATANLEWGIQSAFHDALSLVSEEKVTMVFGADYSNNSTCLVNATGQMLQTGGGNGVPMSKYPDLVSAFDTYNRFLANEGVNDKGQFVTPLAAQILLQHFGELKAKPENSPLAGLSDADEDLFLRSWMQVISADNAPYVNYDEADPLPESAPTDEDIQSLIDAYGS